MNASVMTKRIAEASPSLQYSASLSFAGISYWLSSRVYQEGVYTLQGKCR